MRKTKAHKKQLSPIGKSNLKALGTPPKLCGGIARPKLKSPLK